MKLKVKIEVTVSYYESKYTEKELETGEITMMSSSIDEEGAAQAAHDMVRSAINDAIKQLESKPENIGEIDVPTATAE